MKTFNLGFLVESRQACVIGYDFNPVNQVYQIWVSDFGMEDRFIIICAYKNKNICDEALEFYAACIMLQKPNIPKVILPRKIIYPDENISILDKYENFPVHTLTENNNIIQDFPDYIEKKIAKYIRDRRKMKSIRR